MLQKRRKHEWFFILVPVLLCCGNRIISLPAVYAAANIGLQQHPSTTITTTQVINLAATIPMTQPSIVSLDYTATAGKKVSVAVEKKMTLAAIAGCILLVALPPSHYTMIAYLVGDAQQWIATNVIPTALRTLEKVLWMEVWRQLWTLVEHVMNGGRNNNKGKNTATATVWEKLTAFGHDLVIRSTEKLVKKSIELNLQQGIRAAVSAFIESWTSPAAATATAGVVVTMFTYSSNGMSKVPQSEVLE